MRLVGTDNDGNIVGIEFQGWVRSTNISRDIPSYSQSAATFRITGGLTFITSIAEPAEPVCDIEDPLYLTLAEGETEVGDALLEATGVEILGVTREGIGLDKTTGTPGNRQYKFVGGTGNGLIQIDPNNPGFPGGESIWVLYKISA